MQLPWWEIGVGAAGLGFYDSGVEKDEIIKGRVRLWLRGERAMGLNALAVRRREKAGGAGAAKEPQRVAKEPVREEETRRQPVATAKESGGAGLFVGTGGEPFNGPELPREEKVKRLKEMDEKEVKGCTKCRLSQARTHTVFGEGDPDADIMFIGEGPGESEDLSGRPFVGRAGQKLDKMIAAMGLERGQVYIANIVKCRPPENRAPAPEETAGCTPYLVGQIEIIRPKVIVTLGLPATRYITKLELSMGKLRGQWHTYRGIKVMPTYHPSYILRNYSMETRKAVWSDLQKVMAELGLKGKGK